jgi:hypothetical protein
VHASPLFWPLIVRALVFFAIITGFDSQRLEAAAAGQTQKIVGAANAFLGTLDDTQRGKVNFDFNNAAQRIRWSNLPVNMAERRGLPPSCGGFAPIAMASSVRWLPISPNHPRNPDYGLRRTIIRTHPTRVS